jgi:large subunit GTPase 1
MSKDEMIKLRIKHQEAKHLVTIPKRPKWGASTTKKELLAAENDSFLWWRRYYLS